MRPAGKARRARIPGVFERGATQPDGMQRRPNAAGVSPRAVNVPSATIQPRQPLRTKFKGHKPANTRNLTALPLCPLYPLCPSVLHRLRPTYAEDASPRSNARDGRIRLLLV